MKTITTLLFAGLCYLVFEMPWLYLYNYFIHDDKANMTEQSKTYVSELLEALATGEISTNYYNDDVILLAKDTFKAPEYGLFGKKPNGYFDYISSQQIIKGFQKLDAKKKDTLKHFIQSNPNYYFQQVEHDVVYNYNIRDQRHDRILPNKDVIKATWNIDGDDFVLAIREGKNILILVLDDSSLKINAQYLSFNHR